MNTRKCKSILIAATLTAACSNQEASPSAGREQANNATVEPAAAAKPQWERVGGQGKMQFVVVPQSKEADRTIYDAAISELCKPREWCGIMFWSNRSDIPTSLPMSEAAIRTQTALYKYNPATGYAEFLLACRLHGATDECLSND